MWKCEDHFLRNIECIDSSKHLSLYFINLAKKSTAKLSSHAMASNTFGTYPKFIDHSILSRYYLLCLLFIFSISKGMNTKVQIEC